MFCLSLYFTAPQEISIREEILPVMAPDQIMVQTLISAISPGTETLIYRGQFPPDQPIDETISALTGVFRYPFKYGYSAVGRVIATGPQVDESWQDRLVFAFHPHESRFIATADELLPLPEKISPEDAVFLPNMETALNLVMDGRPLIGERVVVFGQGIIGLLTTALLARFPLSKLVTLDCYPLRRQASLELGAHSSLDPAAMDTPQQLQNLLPEGADLTYELSGKPTVLNEAISATGFDGRVVIGSWYGQKQTHLNLGSRFHRSRIRLLSSQVSKLAPELSGRWTKTRRFVIAWEMLRKVRPSRFITQRSPITDAAKVYQLLDQRPEETIQAVLEYD